MRKNKARILAAALTLSMLLSPFQSFASNKEEAEEKKQEMQQNLNNIESEIDGLEEAVIDIEEFVQNLDIQLSELSNQLTTLNIQVDAKEEDIKTTQEELEAARVIEEKQYEDMKKRIRYMYENGNGMLIEALFQVESMAEFLNQAEYVTKISEYDRNMLVKFQETKDQIASLENNLQQELVALSTIQTEVETHKAEVEATIIIKNTEIQNYKDNISEAEAEKLTYANEIAFQERILAQLKEQEEQEALEQAQRESEAAVKQAEAEAAAKAAAESEAAANVPAPSNPAAEDMPSAGESASGLIWPTASYNVTSEYGDRDAPLEGASNFHGGIDIAGPSGTPIYAAASGVVLEAGYEGSMGNYIILSHAGNMQTVYMHASYLDVSAGDWVVQGQVIAGMGTTGLSTGVHLHFEVRINGVRQNPRYYL